MSTNTATPAGMLLMVAMYRVPESARPAVPRLPRAPNAPKVPLKKPVSVFGAAPGKAWFTGGGDVSTPANGAAVRVLAALPTVSVKRSVARRVTLAPVVMDTATPAGAAVVLLASR